MLEVGWWGGGGSLRDYSKNVLKQGVGKGKSCSKGAGGFEGVTTPAPPENFNHTPANPSYHIFKGKGWYNINKLSSDNILALRTLISPGESTRSHVFPSAVLKR